MIAKVSQQKKPNLAGRSGREANLRLRGIPGIPPSRAIGSLTAEAEDAIGSRGHRGRGGLVAIDFTFDFHSAVAAIAAIATTVATIPAIAAIATVAAIAAVTAIPPVAAIPAIAAISAVATISAVAAISATTRIRMTAIAAIADRTAVAAMAGDGLLLTAQQGDADDCDKSRNPNSKNATHLRILQRQVPKAFTMCTTLLPSTKTTPPLATAESRGSLITKIPSIMHLG